MQATRQRLGDAVAAYSGLLQRVCPGRWCCAWRNPRWFMNVSAVRPTLGGIYWPATANTLRAGVRLAVAALCCHSAVHVAPQLKTTPHSAMLLSFYSPTAKCRRRLVAFAEFDEDAAEQLLMHQNATAACRNASAASHLAQHPWLEARRGLRLT